MMQMAADATPIVTVVIPSHNRAHTVGAAIRSALDQDVDSLEVIVVDDGSVDDTETVVAAIGDPRVRYVRQEKAGANRARNRGIDEARGQFVALLDSDDSFLPGHLQESIENVDDPAGNVVSYARILVDRGAGRGFMKPPRAPRKGEPIAEYLLCDRGFVQTSTVVLPTALARRVRYDETLPFGQDIDFAIRLEAAGAEFRMRHEPGAIWRDSFDPTRISHRAVPDIRMRWLDGLRPLISSRAYYGGRGWYGAKAYRQHGYFWRALRYYVAAVVRRCYDPALAATLFAQIFVPARFYRRLVDAYVGTAHADRAVSRRAEREPSASPTHPA
jgi:glycosyltransferase involved in cell wall biosynthesis